MDVFIIVLASSRKCVTIVWGVYISSSFVKSCLTELLFGGRSAMTQRGCCQKIGKVIPNVMW